MKNQQLENSDFQSILFNYNRLWRQLYYDYLYEYGSFQISICSAEPNGYYNTIHGNIELNDDLEQLIQSTQTKHNVSLGLFLPDGKSREGWKHRPEDDENWWQINLNNFEPCIPYDRHPHVDSFSSSNKTMFESFLRVDAVSNQLSDTVVATLRKNMTKPQEYENTLFVASIDGIACACGYLGIVGNTAFLAEGGVLPEYRARGLHKAITHERLLKAAGKATTAIMVCAAGSASNATAQSLGFQLLTTRKFFERTTQAMR